MKGVAACIFAVLALSGCTTSSQRAVASPTPSPVASQSSSPSPSPSPSPILPSVRAGAPAYAAVAVATLWRSPQSVRPVDAPALANPVRIRQWLAAMSVADQGGLIGRADSQVLLGERVDVISVASGWARVVVPDQPTPLDRRGYPGWIPVAQLTAAPLDGTATVATVIAPSVWLLDHGVPAMEISFGTRLPVIWSRDSIVHVAVPSGELDTPASAVSVTDAGAPALPSTAAAVMASMKLFLNVRYLWAGTSGFGYDCSGLMYTVFKVHGIALPRDAQDQAVIGAAVGRQNLRPGDLVFLASGGVVHHVAIYAGGGMLLDSPDLGRGVQMVSMSVAPYSTEYAGARRLLPV